jgi:hypothetical protein
MKIIYVPELPKSFVYMSNCYEIRGSGDSFDAKKIKEALSNSNR